MAGKNQPESKLPTDMLPVDPAIQSLTADVSIATEGLTDAEREKYIADVQRVASMRKAPFGAFTQKLVLPERQGYKRHWFNDVPGRIEEADGHGWTHVKDKSGQKVKRIVGSQRAGGPLLAYAMEIPKVFWDQDMARRHQIAQDRMDQIRKQPISAQPGMAKKSDADKFYSPRPEALSIKTVDVFEKRPEKAAG